MKYYLHDANSFHDEKIYKLYMEYGYEGLGLFYTFLEKIAQQEKPINENVIKTQLNIGKRLDKIWCFMKKIELISLKNGDVFNENLLNYAESYQIKKEKTRKKVAEWRKNQKDIKDVTSYVSVSNQSKVKLNKVKENNIKILLESSEIWIEDICMKKGYIKQQVIDKLKTFIDDQELKGEMDRPINDIKGHFISWLNKQDMMQNKSYDDFLKENKIEDNKTSREKYNKHTEQRLKLFAK